MTAPAQPCVYHITHVDNLPQIIAEGGLFADAAMLARGGAPAAIGLSNIKQRRLKLPVACHPGDHVGDYVPFYFCPRSIMLFVIHCANHPELTYRGGQAPIVTLEASLHAVVQWALQQPRRWAISLSNAGAAYTEFRSDVLALGELDWAAIQATDFRAPTVKEGKQAEFLLHAFFPWELVARIGVSNASIAARAHAFVTQAAHRPPVEVRRDWYY